MFGGARPRLVGGVRSAAHLPKRRTHKRSLKEGLAVDLVVDMAEPEGVARRSPANSALADADTRSAVQERAIAHWLLSPRVDKWAGECMLCEGTANAGI